MVLFTLRGGERLTARARVTPAGRGTELSGHYDGPVTALPSPAQPSEGHGPQGRRVAVVTLGCARNEVDSEELAGRLAAEGYELVDDADDADAVLSTPAASSRPPRRTRSTRSWRPTDSGASVVAVGCMAERYGSELAGALPEATVLGFDDYGAIGDRLDDVLAGRPLVPHTPRDRRTLLPISPVERTAAPRPRTPGDPRPRLAAPQAAGSGPSAALKLASGCDRRCAFCAIPAFRGAFVSRPAAEVLGEAHGWPSQGVTELVLVSENSTSYGKDLGDLRSLEKLLPQLAAVEGIARVRVAYLQPAELRPGLLEVIAGTDGVAPYFDLSFQHSSPAAAAPHAPVRRHGRLPRAHRAGPRAGAGGRASAPTSSSASRARPRTTSPSSSASSSRAGSTRSVSSATPTRRAPRRWG